jgi:hypothetical protein
MAVVLNCVTGKVVVPLGRCNFINGTCASVRPMVVEPVATFVCKPAVSGVPSLDGEASL